MPDINPILAQTKSFQQQASQAGSAIAGDYAGITKSFEGDAQRDLQIGQNKAIIDQSVNAAALITQNARLKAASDFGTDMSKQNEVITALSQTVAQSYKDRDAALQDIKAKQSISFFDDPVGFLQAQFTINDDIDRHNAAEEELNNAANQIQTINTLTQATVRTQNEITAPINDATIDASKQNILLTAQTQAEASRRQGLISNVEGIKSALNTSKESLDTAFSAHGAQVQEANLSIALQHLALSREEFDWKKVEKQKGEQTDSFFIDMINKGRVQRLGDQADLLVPGSAKANAIIGLIKSNSPAGQQFLVDYNNGQEADMLPGNRRIAASPAEAVRVINTMPVSFSPAAEKTKQLLQGVQTEVSQMIAQGQIDGKNKDVIAAKINELTAAVINRYSSDIRPGDDTNPFNIASLNTLAANSPAIAKLPIVQKLFAPQMKAGMSFDDPSKIFSAVAEGVKNKTITYPEALELSTIYGIGVKTNLEARQFTAVGIVPKFSYNTSLVTDQTAVFSSGKTIYDLTKPDAVGRALNKYLASGMQRDFGRFGYIETAPGQYTHSSPVDK